MPDSMIKKNKEAWWYAPVIPAQSLGNGGLGLQGSLGYIERLIIRLTTESRYHVCHSVQGGSLNCRAQ
jgi:hypothetical protein